LLRLPGYAFLFSLFRQLLFQRGELFKAHDAVYDEENAWIVAVRTESDIDTYRASPRAVRLSVPTPLNAMRGGVSRRHASLRDRLPDTMHRRQPPPELQADRRAQGA
jgi:hypothetical protein